MRKSLNPDFQILYLGQSKGPGNIDCRLPLDPGLHKAMAQ